MFGTPHGNSQLKWNLLTSLIIPQIPLYEYISRPSRVLFRSRSSSARIRIRINQNQSPCADSDPTWQVVLKHTNHYRHLSVHLSLGPEQLATACIVDIYD